MVTGTINITLEGVTMRHVASPISYLRAAQDFFKATSILAAADSPAGPFGSMAGQCLELSLKAFLLSTGMTEADFLPKNKGFGHSLKDAWAACVAKALPIDQNLAQWASHLHGGHASPYMFRYVKDNTGIVLPPKADVLAGLQRVLTEVKKAVGARGCVEGLRVWMWQVSRSIHVGNGQERP